MSDSDLPGDSGEADEGDASGSGEDDSLESPPAVTLRTIYLTCKRSDDNGPPANFPVEVCELRSQPDTNTIFIVDHLGTREFSNLLQADRPDQHENISEAIATYL